jgi:hypothetical protein
MIGASGTFRDFEVSPDNSTWVLAGVLAGASLIHTWSIVPNNYYYRVNGATTLTRWTELR